jgi:hypothetical protein
MGTVTHYVALAFTPRRARSIMARHEQVTAEIDMHAHVLPDGGLSRPKATIT